MSNAKAQPANTEETMISFQACFNTHKDRVFNTALSLLQNWEEAEEVTQDVFVAVYEALPSFRGQSMLSTWLYRITMNKALDRLKARKAKKRSGFIISLWSQKDHREQHLDLPDFIHPGVILEKQESSKALFQAIAQLPENQQSAFVLAKIEQLSYAEIANILDLSIPAVESLLVRAKQKLRGLLKDFYDNH
ncbi:RNA polymerase sigma factor [Haliscomenobacter hydrossis]|uniref:RNA polymerase sigma factor n=1 Tax=Haliscomenobacter hydrossis (strain ATCC 27775 / DSM 1100 / LMG 10767 / O) TaxID=760192 RepID=F4KPE1_HALH1|nr:RNA polymerase sigma factor [Haliscomenobacter hydrossis]AEE49895.1 RNA polymerase, sigma-24 subunit, ECF subfamily [Haliscomenobacter hydrossis DSM 1100]